MIEILSYTFFQNALAGVTLVSVAAAIIGTYIVTRRMVFITGGVTHACFGGLGLGYFLGVSPIMMAGVFAVASSLGVEWLSTKQRVREDSAIGVTWALGMALGTLFIFLTPGYVPELNSFLFGNVLTITRGDLAAFAVYLAALLLVFALLYKPIIVCAFDRDYARTLGLPVAAVNCLMTVLVAICVVLTIRLIGIMLLMALFTMPQMIAETFTRRFMPMAAASAAASVACSALGMAGSWLLGVPASVTVALTLIAVYIITRAARAIRNKTGKKTFII